MRLLRAATLWMGLVSSSISGQEVASQGSWPDFRGPSWNGHAPGASIPLTWDEKTNVLWKTAVPGQGWSSPVIWDDRVWLTSASDDGKKLWLHGFDFASGRIVVSRTVFEVEKPAKKNALNSFASPSPTLEAGRIYVHFGSNGTACIDTETCKTLWERRDLPCDHMEGAGSSPVLVDDLLIVNMDGGDVQRVVALEKATGRTRWVTPRSVDLSSVKDDRRKAYSTPILITVEGKSRLLSSGAEATAAYDPNTGKELWKLRHEGFSMASRPVSGDGIVYLSTGFMRPRLLAVLPTGTGDVGDDHILWSYRTSVPTMASLLLVDGGVYMISDKGVATCVDKKTGRQQWKQKLAGTACASPIYAEERIYFFDTEGTTFVVAPGPEFRLLAKNTLDTGCMASPAVSRDRLLLRTKTHLYCLGIAKREGS